MLFVADKLFFFFLIYLSCLQEVDFCVCMNMSVEECYLNNLSGFAASAKGSGPSV